MRHVRTVRDARNPLRVLLLSLMVLAYLLCSICHAAIVSADATGPAETAATMPADAAPDSGPSAAGDTERPVCEAASPCHMDQRAADNNILALLALAGTLSVLFQVAPPRLRLWHRPRTDAAVLGGTRLLTSLCVQRV